MSMLILIVPFLVLVKIITAKTIPKKIAPRMQKNIICS